MDTGNDAYFFFFEGTNQIMNNHMLKHEHSFFFCFLRQGEHKHIQLRTLNSYLD